MNICVLNAGSSSLKFRLLRMVDARSGEILARGQAERWGTAEAALQIQIGDAPAQTQSIAAENYSHAAEHVIKACIPLGVACMAHRVVHGGPIFPGPVRVTEEVIAGIHQLSELAPLHNEPAIAGIEAGRRLLPDRPSVAVFDTSFHRTIPDVAGLYAIPFELAEKHHLRRYGFHGISHRFVSQLLLQKMNRPAKDSRLITCHLGNGASVCAVRDGISVDTSMGFTPLEGLVMGTRSGDIDAGLVLHLIGKMKMSVKNVDRLLNHDSGLKGISGQGADVRDLEKLAHKGDARALLALEMFAYRIRKYIGAYAAALQGVDAVAFTGGIGEHSARMRERVCGSLSFLGAKLDIGGNQSAPADRAIAIHEEGSSVQLWIVPTNEELQIAREAMELLSR